MPFKFIFTFMLLSLSFTQGMTQLCDTLRYREAIFPIQKTSDIVYGNAPAIPAVYVNESVTVNQDLTLDLYQPIGDTLSRRPMLIFAFGGGFLIGSKEDEDVAALCDSFARKGYVTASINYRLNLNIANSASGERAVYRAVQDWSAAIRFIKENADSLRIDTNWVFGGGVSAGSISGMSCQYMTDAQRPPNTLAVGFPLFAPDLGCKDCSGNSYSHLSSVRAFVNCWGAVPDTAFIDALDSVSTISFHGTLDPVVPYGFGLPFTALLTMPPLYGSSLISQRQDHLGLPNQLVAFPGEGHNVWGTVVNNVFVPGPTQHWEPILADSRDFLWDQLMPLTGAISGATHAGLTDVRTYSVPSAPGLKWCWDVDGGTIVSADPYANSIDVRWDQMGTRYVAVRASRMGAVGPREQQAVQVGPTGLLDDLSAGDLSFSWNSSHDLLLIQGHLNKAFQAHDFLSIRILNLQGKEIYAKNTSISSPLNFGIPTSSWSPGVYFVEFQAGGNRLARKVLKW